MSETTTPASPFEDAIIELDIRLQTLLNNTPIWEAEGNQEQADLGKRKIANIQAALELLRAQDGIPLPTAPIVRSDLTQQQAADVINSTAAFLCAAGISGYLSVRSTVTAALKQRIVGEGLEEGIPVIAVVAVGPQANDLETLLGLEPFNLQQLGQQDVTIGPPPDAAPEESKIIV